VLPKKEEKTVINQRFQKRKRKTGILGREPEDRYTKTMTTPGVMKESQTAQITHCLLSAQDKVMP
jgi:hypothetical protein